MKANEMGNVLGEMNANWGDPDNPFETAVKGAVSAASFGAIPNAPTVGQDTLNTIVKYGSEIGTSLLVQGAVLKALSPFTAVFEEGLAGKMGLERAFSRPGGMGTKAIKSWQLAGTKDALKNFGSEMPSMTDAQKALKIALPSLSGKTTTLRFFNNALGFTLLGQMNASHDTSAEETKGLTEYYLSQGMSASEAHAKASEEAHHNKSRSVLAQLLHELGTHQAVA